MGGDAPRHYRSVAFQMRGDGRINGEVRSQAQRQVAHAVVVVHISLHEDVGYRHLQAARAQISYGADSARQRAFDFGDRIVNFGPVGIHAYLHAFNAQIAQAFGFFLANQNSIGL